MLIRFTGVWSVRLLSLALLGDDCVHYRFAMKRASVELLCASASAVLSILSLAWPQWIELAVNVDVDHGSGSLEWATAVGFGILAAVAAVACWRQVSRPQPV